MSKNKFFFLMLSILGALLLVGCNCSDDAVSVYEVFLDSPVGDVLVSTLNPTFTWHGSDTCEPDTFQIYIREVHGDDTVDHDLPGDMTSYTMSRDSLLPGRQYFWKMMARNDFETGDTGDHTGPFSEEGTFYTGPICSGETLVAPVLQDPYSSHYGNWYTDGGPHEFKWSYTGGCLPESYDFQFASDPGFTDIVLQDTTTEPYLMRTFQGFPNCTSLFFRVAANDGTSVGPWSDAVQVHWVEDDTCWQNNYISDDAARINVRLYQDICEQTGQLASSSTVLDPGCAINEENNRIYADGQHNSLDWLVWNYTVDLGAGPCPSTGLDQMKFDYLLHDEYFHVLAPGTYCVSINRNQTITQNGPPSFVDLNGGMWTDPFTFGPVAEKTVTLGPGTQDVILEFGWDEFDTVSLWIPMPEQIWCRQGPDPICDPLAVIMEGETLPILARDRVSEWKMAYYQGQTCFVYLPAIQIDEALAAIPGSKYLTVDLPIFDPQPPCPPPTQLRECSSYNNENNCLEAGCKWEDTVGRTGFCTDK